MSFPGMEIAFRQKISASSQITDLMVNLHGGFLAAKMLIKIRFVVQLILSIASENTYCWGKDHCMAGLQFYKVAFNCFTKYK